MKKFTLIGITVIMMLFIIGSTANAEENIKKGLDVNNSKEICLSQIYQPGEVYAGFLGEKLTSYLKTDAKGQETLMLPLSEIIRETDANYMESPRHTDIILVLDNHNVKISRVGAITVDGIEGRLDVEPDFSGYGWFFPAKSVFEALGINAIWESEQKVLKTIKNEVNETKRDTEEISIDYLKKNLSITYTFVRGDMLRFQVQNQTEYPIVFYKRGLSYTGKAVYLMGSDVNDETSLVNVKDKTSITLQLYKSKIKDYNSDFKKHKGTYRMHFIIKDKVWTIYFNKEGIILLEPYNDKTLKGY